MSERRPPSPAKLRRALAEGDAPLSAFAVRSVSLAVFVALSPGLGRAVSVRFGQELRAALAAPDKVDIRLLAADVAWLVAPALAAAAVAALATGFVQTGLTTTFRRPAPLLRRLFDPMRPHDVARGVVFSGVLVAIAGSAVVRELPGLARKIGHGDGLLERAGSLSSSVAWASLGVALALAAADVIVRRAAWIARLSPSPEEAKRERRETEGDPDARRVRRRAHAELTRGSEG